MAVLETTHDDQLPVEPCHKRFTGLLPQRMLRYRRPRGWQELAIIAFGYWVYGLVRDAIPGHASIAVRHGFSIQHLQDSIGLDWELSINHFVAAHAWLAQTMDYYYATLHFLVTPAVMVWLFIRRPHVYRGARTVLVAISLIALLGFYLYPTAPPRLLPGAHYIDTVIKFHTWGSLADPNIAKESNQFAAMPSLHIGWALWCGIVIFVCARHLWLRIAGLLYPIGTLSAIVGTANHYLLDAVGAVLLVAISFAVQYLLSGHGAFQPPLDAPDVGSAKRRATPMPIPESIGAGSRHES